jgi:hypothetical protein
MRTLDGIEAALLQIGKHRRSRPRSFRDQGVRSGRSDLRIIQCGR